MNEDRTTIFDVQRRPLGYLVENARYITAYKTSMIPVAKYDKVTGFTLTMANVQLAKGNVVASYLFQPM